MRHAEIRGYACDDISTILADTELGLTSNEKLVYIALRSMDFYPDNRMDQGLCRESAVADLSGISPHSARSALVKLRRVGLVERVYREVEFTPVAMFRALTISSIGDDEEG